MQEFWTQYASSYGNVNDLEEQQRLFVADFLALKNGDLLEFACGNGKVIAAIRARGFPGTILGVDYNKEMIEVARSRLPDETFLQGDILEADTFLSSKKYDFVLCLNSLHNLPDKEMIFTFLDTMQVFVKPGGYILFDIRNSLNPGVNYGYYKNRKQGLQFHTLVPRDVKKLFRDNFECIVDVGVSYTHLPNQKNIFLRFAYKAYYAIIRGKIFSPYRMFIFRKK